MTRVPLLASSADCVDLVFYPVILFFIIRGRPSKAVVIRWGMYERGRVMRVSCTSDRTEIGEFVTKSRPRGCVAICKDEMG